MKNNPFKRIDMRMAQNLVMILIIALFLYLFYFFYTQYASYQKAADFSGNANRAIVAETVEPPKFFHFIPQKEKLNQYRLFTFKEKKNLPADPGKAGNSQASVKRAANFQVVGVVKRDKLFLVVRFNRKLKLFAQGMAIDNQHTVHRLSAKQAVILDRSGRKQFHKIFPKEPLTILNENNNENNKKKKKNIKKTNKAKNAGKK